MTTYVPMSIDVELWVVASLRLCYVLCDRHHLLGKVRGIISWHATGNMSCQNIMPAQRQGRGGIDTDTVGRAYVQTDAQELNRISLRASRMLREEGATGALPARASSGDGVRDACHRRRQEPVASHDEAGGTLSGRGSRSQATAVCQGGVNVGRNVEESLM